MVKRVSAHQLAIAAEQNIAEGEYWLKKLAGDLVKSHFPYDFKKKDISTYMKREEKFSFSPGLFSALQALSKGSDVRLHMVLVTALFILLHKYSGNSDIIIGSPILKQEIDVEYINTLLVFRSQLRGETNFKELLLQVKDVIIEANKNQNYPMEKLLDRLNIPMKGNQFPLFDVVVLLENLYDKGFIQDIHYDMGFSFLRVGESLQGVVEYNALAYRESTIKQIIRHYMHVLDQVLAHVNQPLSQIQLLSEEEKKQVFFDFNRAYPAVDYPADKTLPQLFAEQAARTPDHIALIGLPQPMGGEHKTFITYRQLNQRVNRAAKVLQDNGVGPDSIVALMEQFSIDMMVGILAILKAGGAYLPIDPDHPRDRINYMLSDSGTRVLLKSGAPILGGAPITVLNFEDLGFEIASDFGFRISDLNPSNLAYIIYTSGTTGKPKGVLVRHRNVIAYLHAFYQEFQITEADTVIQLASYSFDVFIEEVFPLLLKGGKILIPAPVEVMDINALARLIVKHQVTIIDCTPLLLSEFNKLNSPHLPGNSFKSVRIFISGGDVLKREYVDNLLNIGSVYNTYGPTEATVCAAYYNYSNFHPGTDNDTVIAPAIPIGKPIANYNIYILDGDSTPVPIGVSGEICIAGDGVVHGYLNSPELTAEKFLATDEHGGSRTIFNQKFLPGGPGGAVFLKSAPPGRRRQKIYKTGDLGRWLEDGNIEFLGRKDDQVKIRGYRIETGEIETRLMKLKQYPIKEAIVIAREDNHNDKYLCAYIVVGEEFELSGLRDSLAGELPVYMIPSFFVPLRQIPLTPNGKIDKKALPEPEINTAVQYVEPQNRTQKQMQKLWQRVIGIEPIGIHDNFFSIGGHSLKGIQLINEIHKEFDIKIPLAEIFRTPTIKELSDSIAGMAQHQYTSIPAVEEKEYYVLSPAQKRLYILQQMKLDSIGYNLPASIPLDMEIDKTRLQETIKKLVQRHESLRTSFLMLSEEPVQRVQRPEQTGFEIEYFAAHENKKVAEIINGFVKPFDLERAPLFRVGVIGTGQARSIFMADMHHIITDAVSQEVLVKDFMRFYNDEDLAPLRIHYKDYAQWQNSESKVQHIKQQEEYWLKEFAGEIPVLDMPADFKRPVLQDFAGDRFIFTLDSRDTQAIKNLASDNSSTSYLVLLALFYILLSRLSGSEDIIIGTLVAGREHADLQNIIGMFVNTLALRNYPQKEKPFKSFMGEVKERTLQAFENQDYPFEELVENAAVNRDASRNPIFDVMFSFHTREEVEQEILEKQRYGSEDSYQYDYRVSKFDLTLTVVETAENFRFYFQYSTHLFSPDTIAGFSKYWQNIISSVVGNPTRRLLEVEIITDEEKKPLLYGFNATEAEYPQDKTLPELFAQQVEKTPGQLAVVVEDYHLTYRELNGVSDKLAFLLVDKGVTAESVVGLLAERSPWMIIAIMGILKAGGVYMPLDPDYPQDRINYMLEDSKARILLKSEIRNPKSRRDQTNPNDRNSNEQNERTSITVLNLEDLDFGYVSNFVFRAWSLRDLGSSHLAYIIYTSGTTGKPKGVMIQHRSVVNLVFGLKSRVYGNEESVVVSLLSPYVFDASIKQIFPALLLGHRLVIVPEEARLDGERLVKYYQEKQVTISDGTPTHLKILLNYESLLRKNFPVGKFVIGGEELEVDLCRRLIGMINKDRFEIINVYGPTECCDVTNWYTVTAEKVKVLHRVPIGKLLDNIKSYILGKNGELQPVGIAGELHISGHGTARGYLNSPELTAEKFLATDEHGGSRTIFNQKFLPGGPGRAVFLKSAPPGRRRQKIYKTGDIARWLHDGNIEFLGRKDDQVKIRGHRIELAEIENRLLLHPQVRESVVLARGHENEEKFLCAYIVTKNKEQEPGGIGLPEYLARTLPAFMIPSSFVFLPELPLTPNGKVDRKALPAPVFKSVSDYTAPRDDIEEKLAEIWRQTLGANLSIGIDDNFFQLGGHSLKATVMAVRVHKVLDVKIPLAEVFLNPTIRQLGEYIKNTTGVKYISIKPAEEKEYYVLSSAQKRLYFLQQVELESTAYNIPAVIHLSREANIEVMEKVFLQLIQRHESLRTSFHMVEDEPVQKVHKGVEFAIEYYSSGRQGDRETGNELFKKFIRPFDLTKAPLVRVCLVKLEKEQHILLDIHHIISDGISNALLNRDFMALSAGETLPLLPVQYKDFSEWQNHLKRTGKLEQQEAYWLKTLAGEIPVLDLPHDFPRSSARGVEGRIVHWGIGKQETNALKIIARQESTTLFMVLLALFNVFLSRITFQEDIVIGTPSAGRPHADLENIIGIFVNTIVLKNHPQSEKTFTGFLKELKTTTLEAFENQDYQFEDLVEKLSLTRETGRNPLFDVMFSLQYIDQKNENTSQVEEINRETRHTEEHEYQYQPVKFDLSLNAVTADPLAFSFEYNPALFKKETIENFIHYFKEILAAVIENKNIVLKEIKLSHDLLQSKPKKPVVDFGF